MKKIFLLLTFVFSMFIVSCDNETDNIQESSDVTNEKMDSFINSNIGIDKNGQFEFTVAENTILKAVKEYSNTFDLDIEPQSIKIIDIDAKKYLRIYSKNNYVSTVALVLDNQNNYRVDKTVCTSKACASGGGCIPNGSYCTECYGSNGLKGDCKRTTTGG